LVGHPVAQPALRCVYTRPGLECLEARLAPAAHDTLATALPLKFDDKLQAQVSASLASPIQVDLYAVQVQAGDEVTARVNAYSPGNPLDSGLRIFDGSGRQLAFNDNNNSYDPALTFTPPTAGLYYVGVSSANDFSYDPLVAGSGSGGNAGNAGDYALSIARSPFAQSGSNLSLKTADVINGNALLQGTLGSNQQDFF